jgi:hypothetical protein
LVDIEYETITINLPKEAMAYIRFKAELNKTNVEKQLQIEVMDIQNAEFEDMRAYEYLELSSFKQAYADIRESLARPVFEKHKIPNQIES